MANKISNKQNFQITGSHGVTIGAVEQKVIADQGSEAQENDPPQRTTILFIAANPLETERLGLDREIKAIEEALRTGRSRELFDLKQAWAATPADLQDQLLRHEPQIVHFSAHGEEGALVLERSFDDVGQGTSAAAQEEGLSGLFSHLRENVRCVVFNACCSAPLARAIAECVDCAIGMAEPIDDTLAVRFAWSFYHALGSGESVKTSFSLACAQMNLHQAGAGGMAQLFEQRADSGSLIFFGDQAD